MWRKGASCKMLGKKLMYDQVDPSCVINYIINIPILFVILPQKQKHFFLLDRFEQWIIFREKHKRIFFKTKHLHFFRWRWSKKQIPFSILAKSNQFRISIFSSFSQHLPYDNSSMPNLILTFSCTSVRQHYL